MSKKRTTKCRNKKAELTRVGHPRDVGITHTVGGRKGTDVQRKGALVDVGDIVGRVCMPNGEDVGTGSSGSATGECVHRRCCCKEQDSYNDFHCVCNKATTNKLKV